MKYEENVWYGWNGGECPVHPFTVVEVRSWAGCSRTASASSIKTWNDDGAQSQPVAFRVIKEHREPREWWVSPTCNDMSISPIVGYVHVREVIE
jgi:hypothetical protein